MLINAKWQPVSRHQKLPLHVARRELKTHSVVFCKKKCFYQNMTECSFSPEGLDVVYPVSDFWPYFVVISDFGLIFNDFCLKYNEDKKNVITDLTNSERSSSDKAYIFPS